MTTAPKTLTKTPAYENNPFFVAVNGIELLFKKAQAVGIALAVIAALSIFASLPSAFAPPAPEPTPATQQAISAEEEAFVEGIASIPVEAWFLIGGAVLLLLLVVIAIGIVISGVIDYTAARLAEGKEVTLSEAFRGVFANFWGYTWVLVIVGFKIFLWSLLLIIPGIIMAIRYSLSGVAYFDKKLSGNASVKESARLTKGAWLTTMASQSLFNLVTLGAIEPVLVPGTQAVLYRQYKDYDVAGTTKPPAHVLSWLTLLLPLALFGLIIAGIVLLAMVSTP